MAFRLRSAMFFKSAGYHLNGGGDKPLRKGDLETLWKLASTSQLGSGPDLVVPLERGCDRVMCQLPVVC